jgi:hypothetical protein
MSRSPVKIASRVAWRSHQTCGRVKRSGPGVVGVMVIPIGASRISNRARRPSRFRQGIVQLSGSRCQPNRASNRINGVPW